MHFQRLILHPSMTLTSAALQCSSSPPQTFKRNGTHAKKWCMLLSQTVNIMQTEHEGCGAVLPTKLGKKCDQSVKRLQLTLCVLYGWLCVFFNSLFKLSACNIMGWGKNVK